MPAKSGYRVTTTSLSTWMALTPPELVNAHLNLDQQVMAALRKTKAPVVPPWSLQDTNRSVDDRRPIRIRPTWTTSFDGGIS
jgi:hypothetical protein